MDMTKLNDWLQVIGIFAVFASLIFVGLEMRQAHKISLSQAYQSRTSAAAEWNSALAANPSALSALRKSSGGQDGDLTNEEYDALYRSLLGVIYLYDNAHYQYQEGFVTEGFWASTRASLKNLMKNPVANAVFVERLDASMRPEFRSVVISILEEQEEKPDE
jgi:hypothetical protein